MNSSSQHALVDAILEYLVNHPQAADSVDGVTRWWLARNGSAPARAEVERALATLVERGLLRRVELPDGTVLYCCEAAARH
jgi:Fe2+ or Zn2+ uptake regulation protein